VEVYIHSSLLIHGMLGTTSPPSSSHLYHNENHPFISLLKMGKLKLQAEKKVKFMLMLDVREYRISVSLFFHW
jgi:hypothetical protein